MLCRQVEAKTKDHKQHHNIKNHVLIISSTSTWMGHAVTKPSEFSTLPQALFLYLQPHFTSLLSMTSLICLTTLSSILHFYALIGILLPMKMTSFQDMMPFSVTGVDLCFRGVIHNQGDCSDDGDTTHL